MGEKEGIAYTGKIIWIKAHFISELERQKDNGTHLKTDERERKIGQCRILYSYQKNPSIQVK